MLKFNNEFFEKMQYDDNSIFICALGYEDRSYYIFDKIKNTISKENMIVFAFKDFVNQTDKGDIFSQDRFSGVDLISVHYEDYDIFRCKLTEAINKKSKNVSSLNIHIDYSQMPRMWYCNLPQILHNLINEKVKVYFWYTEGEYQSDYKEFPTGGIDSFVPFAGMPSLRTNLQRTHILGLSYDNIRTEGILSVLDPERIITCNAYDSQFKQINENVLNINENIINRATLSTSLHIEDFEFMLSKIAELANEFLTVGDVVLVPDGPKPLIFAMSLVPTMIQKKGIVCLQVLRNNTYVNYTKVSANGRVIGFSLRI